MLKLNVGASKKVADQNYGSRGASVNLEIELDMGLVKEPANLQEKIRYLFGLVRQAVTEELNGSGANGHAPTTNNGNGNGNGHAKPPAAPSNNGKGSSRSGGGPRQATQSQVKAIFAIARNRGIDVGEFLNERFHVGRPDALSIKDASAAIDALKDDAGEASGT